MRRPGLLQRTRTPLAMIDGSRRHPAVVTQQRLHLDRYELHPPTTRHVVPGPAVRSRHGRDRAPQLMAGRGQRRVRRHVVRQPQLVDTEPLRRIGNLRRRPGIRRKVRIPLLIHPYPSRVTGSTNRVREVHDLPGVSRVRWRGVLPEPTCRHGGCPLRWLLADSAQPMRCHNPATRPDTATTTARDQVSRPDDTPAIVPTRRHPVCVPRFHMRRPIWQSVPATRGIAGGEDTHHVRSTNAHSG